MGKSLVDPIIFSSIINAYVPNLAHVYVFSLKPYIHKLLHECSPIRYSIHTKPSGCLDPQLSAVIYILSRAVFMAIWCSFMGVADQWSRPSRPVRQADRQVAWVRPWDTSCWLVSFCGCTREVKLWRLVYCFALYRAVLAGDCTKCGWLWLWVGTV